MDSRLKKEMSALLNRPLRWDQPMRDYTSMRVGGPASALAEVENIGELVELYHFLTDEAMPFRVIGRGTNLLVRDEGFQGVAILLSGQFNQYSFNENGKTIIVEAGAGVGLSRLAAECMERGLTGLEFGMGIPGTLGGGTRMNAGAWGGALADVIESVTIVDQSGRRVLPQQAISFSYRNASFPADGEAIVARVSLRLSLGDVETVTQRCKKYSKQRRETQPLQFANAGSVFKNPPNESAGRLIEASRLKGYAIGDAEVSQQHGNFIINRGRAKAQDVLDLIAHVQQQVLTDSGIFLEPEVHIL